MGSRCLWVTRSCGVLSLSDGVTCLRSGLCSSSVLHRSKDFPSFGWVCFLVFVLGSPTSGWSCVLRPALVLVAFPPSSWIGPAPSRWVPLLGARCVWGLQPFSRHGGSLPPLLLCIPSGCGCGRRFTFGVCSFPMLPPFSGQVVVFIHHPSDRWN